MASCPLGEAVLPESRNGAICPLLTWGERKIVDWENVLGRVSGDSYATLGLAVRGSMSLMDECNVSPYQPGPDRLHVLDRPCGKRGS